MRMVSPYQNDSMRLVRNAVRAKVFVIHVERYYIFHIIANMGFWFLVMTGKALLMSPKRTQRVQEWSRQIMGELLLFAILLLCKITTSFV